jgi:subtilisin family serine protease
MMQLLAMPWFCLPAQAADAPSWLDFMPQPPQPVQPELDGRGLVVAVLDTGVDPLASGLTRTSTGQVKVLEARDFTGQGDVSLEPVTVADDKSLVLDGVRLQGSPAPVGDAWLGYFAESQIGPPELRDLNRNGKTDDKLAVLVWRTGPGADDTAFVLDLNSDLDFAGEQTVRPYHVAQELIALRGGRPDRDLALLSLAAEIDWRKTTAQLHFCDGSHGTHVAGIISGYKMFGQEGWNGIAPGAQVLSLKIGHNARSGGATPTGAFVAALEFAGQWSSRHQRPVVLNASYGVGSGTEGQTAIDAATDAVARKYPLLTIAYSAGNAGPGLSSVGTPAGADLAMAVGAVLPKTSAATLYGGALTQDELFAFSSRGAELAKPEVVAPGAAAASVPIWDDGEIKQGTSMAAPQVAGAMLRVWAAVLQNRPKDGSLPVHWTSGLVRRALQFSAKPLAGYTPLDQGSGLVDIDAASQLAVRTATNSQLGPLLGLRFRGKAAGQQQATPALFLRSGAPGPVDLQTAVFQLGAVLPASMAEKDREAYALPVVLSSSAAWLQLKRPQVLLRGERTSPVEMAIALPASSKPGVYVAELFATAAGVRIGRTHVAVVVPTKLPASGEPWLARNQTLGAGKVWRQFVVVPAHTKHLRVDIKRSGNDPCEVALAMHDPDGHRIRPAQRVTSRSKGTDALWQVPGDDLQAGVWEITVAALATAPAQSRFDVQVTATAASAKPIALAAKGGSWSGQTAVRNLSDAWVTLRPSGRMDRAVKSATEASKGSSDRIEWTVQAGGAFRRVELQLAVDVATWDKVTDLAITVKDSSGNVVAEDAFGSPKAEVSFAAGEASQTYTVVLEAGFAHKAESWQVKATTALKAAKAIGIVVQTPGPVVLPPLSQANITIVVPELPPAPAGYTWEGDLELDQGTTRWLSLPIRTTP